MSGANIERKELINRITASMRRMRRLGAGRMRQYLAGFDMTMPQVRTLDFLSHGPKRMKELSDHRMRGMPAATSMIDRLVKKGYVERKPDPADRRAVLSNITDSGRKALEDFARIGAFSIESAAVTLTDEELSHIAPALELLEGAMSRASEDAGDACDGPMPARERGGRGRGRRGRKEEALP